MLLPSAYRAATIAAAPLVRLYLARRRRRGKEDPARRGERFGIAGLARPAGRLVWIHAASVGEATSVLPLIARLRADRPGIEILVTTGTVASAALLDRHPAPRLRHQYAPVDLPRAVRRFLDHWHPELAIWIESELWPNLILATQARGIPMALVNGRLSARSQARWQRWPGLVRPILAAFPLCLAQDSIQATRLQQLGAVSATSVGDLKAAAAPLAVDAVALAELQQRIGARPRWLAASTHPDEEAVVAVAHHRIAATHPGLLTIIAPRHPARGDAIAEVLAGSGLHVARRSLGDEVAADTDIYLADTMGELGLFYRLAGIAFIGGSLAAKGGHNPFEAARLDCAILHGPDMSNCAAMAAALDAADATTTITGAADLADRISDLLVDPALRDERAAAAARAAATGLGVLDAVLARLAPWLDPLVPTRRGGDAKPQRRRA